MSQREKAVPINTLRQLVKDIYPTAYCHRVPGVDGWTVTERATGEGLNISARSQRSAWAYAAWYNGLTPELMV